MIYFTDPKYTNNIDIIIRDPHMKPSAAVICLLLWFCLSPPGYSQSGEASLNIFGYFQNSFQHWTPLTSSSNRPDIIVGETRKAQNAFSMQQLNLFLSKDLSRHWRAFVNFEALNNFSSQRRWGGFNLEEAWVRYKPSDYFNLKLGLLIPEFNHLNEIKNRTPLLPYIIRPLIYETSFYEFVGAIEQATPARAFLQAGGTLLLPEAKMDYALYLGNSPNIATWEDGQQSGVDTTTNLLVGGRLGLRDRSWKAGISLTYDRINIGIRQVGVAVYDFIFRDSDRIRLGGDLLFNAGRVFFEGEGVKVMYDEVSEIRIDGAPPAQAPDGDIGVDGHFFYGTLGYHLGERSQLYGGYWYIKGDFIVVASQTPRLYTTIGSEYFTVHTAGFAHQLNERITVKGQYSRLNLRDRIPLLISYPAVIKGHVDHFALAVSVFF